MLKILEVMKMAVRRIIHIDEEKCNGCGLCVPNCAEGAIQIIEGKARLVKDSYCDGLGACLGHCPQDALHIIEREAEDFDEEAVAEALGKNACRHNQPENKKPDHAGTHHYGGGGCPGSRMMFFREDSSEKGVTTGVRVSSEDVEIKIRPQLKQWPVQLHLVPVNAPYFENADLLVTADCVPFAYPNYHLDLLKGRAVVVGCPKLDDIDFYVEKLTEIFENNSIKSITVAHMEVPCCSGIVRAVEIALQQSGKAISVNKVRIGINGEAQNW